jgi:hypothetical protein
MDYPLLIHIPGYLLAVPYFLLLVLLNWAGYKYRQYQVKKFPDTSSLGLGTAEGSLLGLMALLLSFSFGISASKYESRKDIIVQEANNIGTTILRCDLYPDSLRNLFRTDLKNYVEARIAYFDAGDDAVAIQKALRQADSISTICWKRTAWFSRNPAYYTATMQMVPSLNATIDIVSTRDAGRRAVLPRLILNILIILTLASSFLTGYGSKIHERKKVLVFAFALMTTSALYLVIDLDRPRQGLINLNDVEQQMITLRNNFR